MIARIIRKYADGTTARFVSNIEDLAEIIIHCERCHIAYELEYLHSAETRIR